MKTRFLSVLGCLALLNGCSSQEVPPAHKGRMFDKTGALALYMGGKGFEGDVLGSGTHFTAIYPEVRMVNCAQQTIKEQMTALTKDGVQFSLDVYIRFGANCENDSTVKNLLETLSPEPVAEKDKSDDGAKEKYARLTITSTQIYTTFVRPAIGEAVRVAVSPYIANEINSHREELFNKIGERFSGIMNKPPKLVSVMDLNLSNLDFPDEMDKANTERAVQSILKDKAIAERERVTAEIETTNMRKQLAESEAANDVVKINAVGQALKKNPEFLQYDAQQRWNDIYFHAGEKGNMVIMSSPNTPLVLTPPKK